MAASHPTIESAADVDATLSVRDVTHAFGRSTVVCDASLRAAAGEVHCLLGPSGSGKTTLLRLVAGLERLQHGRIDLMGATVATPLQHTPPERRVVGFVFHELLAIVEMYV